MYILDLLYCLQYLSHTYIYKVTSKQIETFHFLHISKSGFSRFHFVWGLLAGEVTKITVEGVVLDARRFDKKVMGERLGRREHDPERCWLIGVDGCCWMLMDVDGCCWMLMANGVK